MKGIGTDTRGFTALAAGANTSALALQKATVSAAHLQRRLAAIQVTASGGAFGAGGALPALASAGAGRVPRGGGVIPPLPTPGGGGTPRLPGGGGGAGGGRGGGAGGGFHGGNIHLGPRGVGLGTVGMAAGDWFWPLAASGAAIYGGKALFEAAKDKNTEENRFRLFGLTEAQNQDAFRYAGGLNIYGTTQVERLRAMREAQGVFRESGLPGSQALEGAKLAAPTLAKLDFIAASLDEESAAKMKTANMAMLRFIESSGGLKSAPEFNRLADLGFKLAQSSGGAVDFEQLRQLIARGGGAATAIDSVGMAELEPLIAERKGGAVGFGLSTAFNRLTGSIRIPNQVAHLFTDSHLWDKSKVVFNSNGGIKTFTGNPLGDDKTRLLTERPFEFYMQYLHPLWEKMKLSSADRIRMNIMAGGTTGGRNFNDFERFTSTIERSRQAMQKVKGIDASVAQVRGSLSGQEKEFEAAWTDFKTQFGTKMLPFFTGILKAGSAVLRVLPDAGSAATSNKTPIGAGLNLFAGAARLLAELHSSRTSYVPSGGVGRTGVSPPVVINIDGRKVATAVSAHQARAAAAPQTGTSGFDSRSMMTPAGF